MQGSNDVSDPEKLDNEENMIPVTEDNLGSVSPVTLMTLPPML
jgi:hypothetical protein